MARALLYFLDVWNTRGTEGSRHPVGLLEADGSAVNQHLGGLRHDGGGGVSHPDDGVSPKRLRLGHHAVGGQSPRILHHLGVGPELAAHDVFQRLSEIADEILRLDGTAGDSAQHLIIHARQIFYSVYFHTKGFYGCRGSRF